MDDATQGGLRRPLAATIGVSLLSACLIANVARAVLMPSALAALPMADLSVAIVWYAFLAVLIALIACCRRWALIAYLVVLLLYLPQLWNALQQAAGAFPSIGWPGWDVATVLAQALAIGLLFGPRSRRWFVARRRTAPADEGAREWQ